ncbi:MAG: hypothetical protein B7Z69_00345 [Actinobacteria bacterium 21-73-9]|nr:MAG: hypothetical protein B7Z69_00345 [Actinobacteria bacterium 21-73-9]
MGHPLIGGLVTLLVVGLLLALAVAAVAVLVRGGGLNAAGHSSPPNRGAGASANDEALRILSQRFARGEIDAGEYVERRDLLKQSA